MIKAVIFDIGGVIIHYTNDPYYQYLSRASKKSHLQVKTTVEKNIPPLESSSMTLKEFEQKISKKLGIPPSKVKWVGFYKKHWTLNEDVVELIKILHKDCVTAFLSNVDLARYDNTYKFLPLDDFDYRFRSYSLKTRKPSAKIFRIVLKTMKIKPNEAVFIDDRIENILAARKLGINAIHFKNRRLLDKALAKVL